MNSNKALLISTVLLITLIAVSLGACNFPTPTPESCSPADLAEPELGAPANRSLVDTFTPTFTWNYAGACEPDGYAIELSVDEDFATGTTEMLTHPTMSWTPSSDLRPATEYWWRVSAYIEVGGSPELGPHVYQHRFYTGPVCEGAELLAPMLDWPGGGETVDTVMPLLDWSYPLAAGCVPRGYRIDLSTESEFADTSLSGGTGTPGTRWFPGEDLTDCTLYFWRVAGITGETLGPFSPTQGFYVDTGACPPTGVITGFVWHDLCAVPWEGSGVVPPGCIEMPDGSIEADGVYDETTEPGIQDVTVHLGSGPCPSTGLATDMTNANGAYAFMGLSGGTYCVTVDALNDGNDLILIPGKWTYYDRGLNPQQLTISIAEHHAAPWVNFGWDYQFLPAPALPSPTPVIAPESMEGLANANARCRFGPLLVYDTIAYLNEGDPVTIEGRNFSGSWLWILRPGSSDHCWVAANLIDKDGDTDLLPVIEPPPTPTPKPSPTPKPTMTPTLKPYK
jgi:hypothetical protein